jgi:L-seryl-tRNA(Ser) seleniumtransferase
MTQPESPLIALTHPSLSAHEIETRLRQNRIPIIVRITDDRVMLDLRTVSAEEESDLLDALFAL